MCARLMALIAMALFILLPLQPSLAGTNVSNQEAAVDNLELPSALAEDDSFNDLPFEQLRQALREEVEHEPQKTFSPRSPKRYNLLIR